MIACNNEDSKWKERKMEGEDGVRTVECLRGRLLAERHASKTAKEDAEVMGNKLIELENKLKEETKLRNKAEKRLKLLRKKVESLNILPNLEESEQPSSSEFSSVSSTSTKGTEGSAPKSQNAAQEMSKDEVENASDTTFSFTDEEKSNSSESTKSDSKDSSNEKHSGKSSSSLGDPEVEDTSSSSLKASTMKIEIKGRNDEDEDDDYVDNSLALVPTKLPESKPHEIKINSKSIVEVLDTLRHARERIQSSLERRQMIRVGPS